MEDAAGDGKDQDLVRRDTEVAEVVEENAMDRTW